MHPDQFIHQPLIKVPIISACYYRWGVFYRMKWKKYKMWNESIKHETMCLKVTVGFKVKCLIQLNTHPGKRLPLVHALSNPKGRLPITS